MNKQLLRIFFSFFLLLTSSQLFAQSTQSQRAMTFRTASPRTIPNEGQPTTAYQGLHSSSLPLSISIPGVDLINVQSSFPFQSNSRALHNIQVDPSNPLRIHAVLVGTTDVSVADTHNLNTRRCFYVYSADGGHTWSAPKIFSTVRTGYPDMKLMQRNGQYVPVIGAHRVPVVGSATAEAGLWIESGNPGDGKFVESVVSTGDQGFIWPTIAVSPDSKTVYMVAAKFGASAQMQFGTWTINPDATATWNSFAATPGSGDANFPNAGNTTGGVQRIQVAPSGKIGIAWINTDKGDGSNGEGAIYYVESTDKGQTWPTTVTQVAVQTADPVNAGFNYVPDAFDFWFDGESPRFIYESYSLNSTSNLYIPHSAGLYFLDHRVADTGITIALTDVTAATPNSVPSILQMPAGSKIQPQGQLISWPTIAPTPLSKTFSAFYQTYIEGDSEIVATDTGYLYSSIYQSTTTDGGKSWSTPAAVVSATNGPGQKYDVRFPQTSDFNPVISGAVTFHTLFSIDTAAGFEVAFGLPGFDVITFGHKAVGLTAGVNDPRPSINLDLGANHPNPFTGATSIDFTLVNASNVTLAVEDMLGRTIATVVNGHFASGPHTASFDASRLPAGVYRYTLTTEQGSVSKSMTVLR